MADQMRLSDGINTFDFSPESGFVKPDDMDIRKHKAVDGSSYVYKFSVKRKWEVPLADVRTASATLINGWWSGCTELTFYPDLTNSPAESFIVRLFNDERPLGSFNVPRWEDFLSGALIIQEI